MGAKMMVHNNIKVGVVCKYLELGSNEKRLADSQDVEIERVDFRNGLRPP